MTSDQRIQNLRFTSEEVVAITTARGYLGYQELVDMQYNKVLKGLVEWLEEKRDGYPRQIGQWAAVDNIAIELREALKSDT